MSRSTDPAAALDYYSEFKAELEEILRHKWLESEKAEKDIGFEKALTEWAVKYRMDWRRHRGLTA